MSDPDRTPAVRLEREERADRVTVLVDGDRFTAYRYGDPEMKKPILFPINAPSGAPVTRGYPVESRPDDRRDHPHQAGHWFNYGDVDGFDFWNNSEEVPAERAGEMGTIRHREVTTAVEREGAAELEVRCDWCRPDESVLAEESTRFEFRARPGVRLVDRTTTLTAREDPVTFHDDKEGLFGLRVARSLELPVAEDLVFVDSGGEETVVTATGDHEVTGTYRSSEGATDADAWGSRAEWMALSGNVGDEDVTVAILDHPGNPGYPAYWMARPYGLFAANPLGRAVFEDGAEPMDFTIDAGDAATFRYRLLVRAGDADPSAIDAEHRRFVDAG
jgi:hypothetical protein